MEDDTLNTKIKPRKQRNVRKRIKTEESDDEETVSLSIKLEEMKEIQNLRKKPNGVDVIDLAFGAKSANETTSTKDAFKIEAGGMVNMKALKLGQVKQIDDAYDTGIGTHFSVETNKRDEDEEMMKYIEEELSKWRGKTIKGKIEINQESDGKNTYLTPEDAALQAVPKHLRESSAYRSEEMLSNQMLSGIPEVDLGIEAKIKNIEATEEAKLKLLWEKQNKADSPSSFVPSNMAVNFVQHNRFNVDEPDAPKKRKILKEPEDQLTKKSEKKKEDKATDDYFFEKFKKQFRR